MHARMMGTIRKHPTSTLEEESKYYGVSWDGVKEQWKATVQVAPGSAQTVCFWWPTAVKAAACYDCAQHELYRIHKQPVVFNYIQYPDDFAPGSWRAFTGPVQQKLHESRSVTSNKSQHLADAPAPTCHPSPARPPLVTATTTHTLQPPPIVQHLSPNMQPSHQPQQNLSHQRPSQTNAPTGSAMPTTVQQKPISPTAAAGTPSAARGGKKLWAPGAKERRPVQLIDRNEVIAVSKVPLAQQPAPAAQPNPTGVSKTPRPRGRPKGSKSRTPSAPHPRTFKTTPRVTPGVEQTKLPLEKPSMAQLFSSKFRLPSFKKQPSVKAEAAPSAADQRSMRKDPRKTTDACEDGVPSLGDELSDMDINDDSCPTAPSTVPAKVPSKRIPDTKTQVSADKLRPPKLQIDRMCQFPQHGNGRQLNEASLPPAKSKLHDATPARVQSVASELHTPQDAVASAGPAKSTAATTIPLPPAKPILHNATPIRVPAVVLELHTPQGQVASAGPARTAAAITTPKTPAQTPAHASAYDNDEAHLFCSAAGRNSSVGFKLGNSLASPQLAMEASPASRPGSACNTAPLPAAVKQSAMTSTVTTALVIMSSEEAHSTSATTATSISASSSSDDSRVAEEVTSGQVTTLAEAAAAKPAQAALAASPIIGKPAECQQDCAQLSDAPDSIIRIQSGPAAGKCYALNFTRKGTRVVGICSSEKEAKTPSSALKAQHHPPAHALSLSDESASASEQWSESDAPSEVVASPQHSDYSPESEGDSGERVPLNHDAVVEVGTAAAVGELPCTTLAVDHQAAELEGIGDESNFIGLKEIAHALENVTAVLESTANRGEPVKGERTTLCAMQRVPAVEVELVEQEAKTAEPKDTGLSKSNAASRKLLETALAEPLASSGLWCKGYEVREQAGNMQDDAKDSVSPAYAGSSPISAATSAHKCDAPPSAIAAGALEITDLHPTSHALASADRVQTILLEALDCARKSANTTTSSHEDMQPASPAPEIQRERMQCDSVATLDESEVRMHNTCSVSRGIRVDCSTPTSTHVDVERMEEEVVVMPEHANKVKGSSSAPESTQLDAIANMDKSTVRLHNTCSMSCELLLDSEMDANVCPTPTSPHAERMEEAVVAVLKRANKVHLSSSAQESTQPDAIPNLDESTVRMQNTCSVSRDIDMNSAANANVCPMPTPPHVDVDRMEEEVAVMREHAHSCIANSPAQGSTQPNAAVDKGEVCGHKSCSVSREDGVHAEADADSYSTPTLPNVNAKRINEDIAVLSGHANSCSLSSLARGSTQPNDVATLDESDVRMNTWSVSCNDGANAETDITATTLHIEAKHMEEEVPTISKYANKRSSSSLSTQPLDRRKRQKLDLDLNMKVDEDMGPEQTLQPDGDTHTTADIQSDGQPGDSLVVEASSSEDTERLASEATEATEVLSTPEDDGNAFTSPFAACLGGAGLNGEVNFRLHADASKGDNTSLATPPINNNTPNGVASEVMDSDRINNVVRASQSASVLPPNAGYSHQRGMGKGYTYEVRGNIWRATFNSQELGSSPVFKNSVQAELGYLLGLAAIELFEDLTSRKQFVRKAFDVVPDCLDDIPAAGASSSSTTTCIELQGRLIELGKVLSVNETGRINCHWQRRQERDAHVEPVDRAALGKAEPCVIGKRPRGRPRKDGTISGPRRSYADVAKNPSLRPYYECSVATQLLQLLTDEAMRLGWTLPPD